MYGWRPAVVKHTTGVVHGWALIVFDRCSAVRFGGKRSLSLMHYGAFSLNVIVDGEVIASREQGFLKRLLGGGWPAYEVILRELQRRHAGRRAAQQAE